MAGGDIGELRRWRAHPVQVDQGAKYEAALRVLVPPVAAHLAKPENAFDPSKRLLHPGAVAGPLALDWDALCHVGGHLPQAVCLAHAGRIAPHIGLRAL